MIGRDGTRPAIRPESSDKTLHQTWQVAPGFEVEES